MRRVQFALTVARSVCRKLKKLLQKKKSELDSKQEEELNKTLLSYEKDHILCPFIGINPEYMEMSESQHVKPPWGFLLSF